MKKIFLLSLLFLGVNYVFAKANLEQLVIEEQAGNYDNALKIANVNLQDEIKEYGKKHYKVAIAHNLISIVLNEKKEYQESIKHSLLSLKISESLSKQNQDIETIEVSHRNLASTYSDIDEYDKALKHYEKVLNYRINPLSINHDRLWMVLVSIGQVYQDMKEYKTAKSYFIKASEKTSSIADHIIILDLLGQLSEKSKEYKSAIRIYKELRKIAKSYQQTPEIIEAIEEFDTKILNFENQIKNEGKK
jgi:tetratricopeptide (TPR) repeat protein